jgi:type II secretory pathway pseudopilin PulG
VKKNNQNLNTALKGFTLFEAMASVVILSMITVSVLVVVNNMFDKSDEMNLRKKAFEVARDNMEMIISQNSTKEYAESGFSEIYPDIEWEVSVETFTPPQLDSEMWLKAYSSAFYLDSDGQGQQVKLEHWLTQLNVGQKKQILDEQKREEEYLEGLGFEDDELGSGDEYDFGDESEPADSQDTELNEMERKLQAGEITEDEFLDWAIGQ